MSGASFLNLNIEINHITSISDINFTLMYCYADTFEILLKS